MALTAAEKQRLSEMKEDICSISAEELDNYTLTQWTNWLNSYVQYCSFGGVRPPHRPPI